METLMNLGKFMVEPVNCLLNYGMKIAVDTADFIVCVINNMAGGVS